MFRILSRNINNTTWLDKLDVLRKKCELPVNKVAVSSQFYSQNPDILGPQFAAGDINARQFRKQAGKKQTKINFKAAKVVSSHAKVAKKSEHLFWKALLKKTSLKGRDTKKKPHKDIPKNEQLGFRKTKNILMIRPSTGGSRKSDAPRYKLPVPPPNVPPTIPSPSPKISIMKVKQATPASNQGESHNNSPNGDVAKLPKQPSRIPRSIKTPRLKTKLELSKIQQQDEKAFTKDDFVKEGGDGQKVEPIKEKLLEKSLFRSLKNAQAQAIKETKEPKPTIKEVKETKQAKPTNEVKEVKQPKQPKPVKEVKETKQAKPTNEVKEIKQAKPAKEPKETKPVEQEQPEEHAEEETPNLVSPNKAQVSPTQMKFKFVPDVRKDIPILDNKPPAQEPPKPEPVAEVSFDKVKVTPKEPVREPVKDSLTIKDFVNRPKINIKDLESMKKVLRQSAKVNPLLNKAKEKRIEGTAVFVGPKAVPQPPSLNLFNQIKAKQTPVRPKQDEQSKEAPIKPIERSSVHKLLEDIKRSRTIKIRPMAGVIVDPGVMDKIQTPKLDQTDNSQIVQTSPDNQKLIVPQLGKDVPPMELIKTAVMNRSNQDKSTAVSFRDASKYPINPISKIMARSEFMPKPETLTPQMAAPPPETKVEAQPEIKVEAQPEIKMEAQPEMKVETQPKPEPEIKVAPQPVIKVATKPKAKVETPPEKTVEELFLAPTFKTSDIPVIDPFVRTVIAPTVCNVVAENVNKPVKPEVKAKEAPKRDLKWDPTIEVVEKATTEILEVFKPEPPAPSQNKLDKLDDTIKELMGKQKFLHDYLQTFKPQRGGIGATMEKPSEGDGRKDEQPADEEQTAEIQEEKVDDTLCVTREVEETQPPKVEMAPTPEVVEVKQEVPKARDATMTPLHYDSHPQEMLEANTSAMISESRTEPAASLEDITKETGYYKKELCTVFEKPTYGEIYDMSDDDLFVDTKQTMDGLMVTDINEHPIVFSSRHDDDM